LSKSFNSTLKGSDKVFVVVIFTDDLFVIAKVYLVPLVPFIPKVKNYSPYTGSGSPSGITIHKIEFYLAP
jgi:hypothetical protein